MIKSKDFAGGILLFAVGTFFLWLSLPLPVGSLQHFGPGMLPKTLSTFLAIGGAMLTLKAAARGSSLLEDFHWRPTLSLLAAFVVFALLIRSAGLVVAAPCSLTLAYYAEGGRSFGELAAIVIAVTAGCILLFKTALGLPIPLLTISW